MKSATLPSFWVAYRALNEQDRRGARNTYHLWLQNPFHPSLHFKCINRGENIWSVRVTRSCRAIGILEGDTVTWFWIGGHDEYESFFV